MTENCSRSRISGFDSKNTSVMPAGTSCNRLMILIIWSDILKKNSFLFRGCTHFAITLTHAHTHSRTLTPDTPPNQPYAHPESRTDTNTHHTPPTLSPPFPLMPNRFSLARGLFLSILERDRERRKREGRDERLGGVGDREREGGGRKGERA